LVKNVAVLFSKYRLSNPPMNLDLAGISFPCCTPFFFSSRKGRRGCHCPFPKLFDKRTPPHAFSFSPIQTFRISFPQFPPELLSSAPLLPPSPISVPASPHWSSNPFSLFSEKWVLWVPFICTSFSCLSADVSAFFFVISPFFLFFFRDVGPSSFETIVNFCFSLTFFFPECHPSSETENQSGMCLFSGFSFPTVRGSCTSPLFRDGIFQSLVLNNVLRGKKLRPPPPPPL